MTLLPWEHDIEQALVERLNDALNPLPVEPLPEKQWKFTHPKGAALVMWSGAQGDQTVDIYIQAQPAVLTYTVVLFARSLRNAAGLYPMWAATRQALIGFQPNGLKPMRLVNVRFGDVEDTSVWTLVSTWQTEAMYMADENPDVGPLLKQLTFDEED